VHAFEPAKEGTKHMKNNKLCKRTRHLARPFTARAAVRNLTAALAVLALTLVCVPDHAFGGGSNPKVLTSLVLDPAGDAVFPFDLYNAPVPPYLDMVAVSVSSWRGVFHFEIQMNATIPANPFPGFTPSVNHLGATFGILTDRKTAGSAFKFFGQTDSYHFNFLVGALYSFADSGVGLPLGWTGFFIDVSTFAAVPIPVQIQGDTLVFETSAASLGNPTSFQFVVGCECDPVPIPVEKTKSVLLPDFAPDHDYASWQPVGP
jgi:hypothetical protein